MTDSLRTLVKIARLTLASFANHRDISRTLAAAHVWIERCLKLDHSLFQPDKDLWTTTRIAEVYESFVQHPNLGTDSFMTKLKGQLNNASPAAKQLSAEMLWALLLFPSNMKPATKKQQIAEIWELSGERLPMENELLSDEVLGGIGSGGPGFNNYRPDELAYLIELTLAIKRMQVDARSLLTDYERFCDWIETVPREGNRQYRHMLRYFAFPDRVERISSNNDRFSILDAFGCK